MSSRGTILVVDDDHEIANAACLRLRAAGFETIVVYDGQPGIDSAQRDQPRAILLDVRMPHMDGLAALEQLKHFEGTKRIPVVMLSASMRDEQAALDCGARFFVHKPYNGPELVVALESAMREAGCLTHPAAAPLEERRTSQPRPGRSAGAPISS
jgi:DNA-binding response OmpR family regulator